MPTKAAVWAKQPCKSAEISPANRQREQATHTPSKSPAETGRQPKQQTPREPASPRTTGRSGRSAPQIIPNTRSSLAPDQAGHQINPGTRSTPHPDQPRSRCEQPPRARRRSAARQTGGQARVRTGQPRQRQARHVSEIARQPRVRPRRLRTGHRRRNRDRTAQDRRPFRPRRQT